MTALSRRMEILVFPASGFTTAPRLAREKSMSRYFSATALFIGLPLAPVRFPRRDQPDSVGFLVRVNDDEHGSRRYSNQRHEPRFGDGRGVLACEREVVLEDGHRLREGH